MFTLAVIQILLIMRFLGLLSVSTILIVLTILVFWKTQQITQHSLSSSREKQQSGPLPSSSISETAWLFDVTRDARNRGLTEEQCDSTFPRLWEELYRAQNWHRKNTDEHLIKEHDIDQYDGRAQLRLMIYNGQVSDTLLNHRSFHIRTRSIEERRPRTYN